ncbi:MAG: hypothetical protein J0L92_25745 [Deltaproteobacteria bacterium]|nr:hypothetical protein [Deltaproteobacteria bacterium]
MTTHTLPSFFVAITAASSALAGCASAHPSVVSDDLACAPEDLRSAWWSGEGGFYGYGDLLVDRDTTHVLVADDFRAATLRLSDGQRAEARSSRLDLLDVAGLRVAMPRMRVDVSGASDLAGATDVFEIGDETPLVTIPWIAPRDEGAYASVLAHVGQSSDRVTMLERVRSAPTAEERIFLRHVRVSDPSDEQRVEITSDLSLGESWGPAPWLLVDEAREVAFLVYSSDDEAPSVRILRVALATGVRTASSIVLTEAAPVLGRATIGAPEASVLDATISDEGSTLFLTTRDGALRELDADTLDEIGAPRSSVLVVANPDTYLPTLRSPVALSPHGAWIAQLDAQGHVAIAPRLGGEMITLPSSAPALDVTDGARGPNAMLVRFLPDGLLVITDAGVERFRCAE